MDKTILARLGRKTHVSMSGLSQILKELRDEGHLHDLPAATRQTIKRARTAAISVLTAYGSLLVTITILLASPTRNHNLTYIQPAALLSWLSVECPMFRRFLTRVWTKCPCSYARPWKLVIYSDEVLPGNQLKHVNLRKLQTIYWSILEFGSHALSLEAFWFTLTVIRSSVVSRISGGMSAIFRILMAAFHDSSVADFLEGGVQVQLDHGPEIIVCRISTMISDLCALKQVIENKGTSGTIFCAECRNVLLERHAANIVQPHPRFNLKLYPATELDVNNFVMHTNTSVFETAKYLKDVSEKGTKTNLNAEQQYLGFNIVPDGIVLDERMNKLFPAITSLMYDWMHIFLVHGIFQLIVGLMINHFRRRPIGITHTNIHAFVSTFVWPTKFGGKSADGKDVFEKRSRDATYLQCSASEGLAVFPVFELFCTMFILGKFTEHEDRICECYFALCTVLRTLMNLANKAVPWAKLMELVVKFLKLFLEVWGEDEWIPKCHFALHLPLHLARHLILLNCWVLERKHKFAKNTANGLCNTGSPEAFEVPILEDILYHQHDFLSRDDTYPGQGTRLIRGRAAKPKEVDIARTWFGAWIVSASISREAANGVIHFSVGDAALANVGDILTVVEVLAHYDFAGTCASLVCPWTRMSQHVFRTCESTVFIATSELLDLCVYRVHDADPMLRHVVPCKF